MLHSYQAILEDGKLKWLDTKPSVTSAKVIVTVLSPVEEKGATQAQATPQNQNRQFGFMQGEMRFPDDINWGDKQKDLFAQN